MDFGNIDGFILISEVITVFNYTLFNLIKRMLLKLYLLHTNVR